MKRLAIRPSGYRQGDLRIVVADSLLAAKHAATSVYGPDRGIEIYRVRDFFQDGGHLVAHRPEGARSWVNRE